MMHKILILDGDKWTKFEFIHYYPGKFSLFLIFIGPSGVAIYNNSLLPKSKRKAMNRNWYNQKANPALNIKAGNK